MQKTSLTLHRRSLAAWRSSYFCDLPVEVRDRILRDAFVVNVPAGSTIYEAYSPARLALLHTGQARVKVVSPEGRVATIRYAGPGQVIGLPSAVSGSSPVGADAIIDCELSMLNVATIQKLAASDATLAWLLAQQLSDIIFETVELLGGNLFGTVQQRVSRHLLDLAENSGDGPIVQVDQHDLADAIGSVREVVARALRKLREAGFIERVPSGIRLVSPSELHSIAAGTSGDPDRGSTPGAS